MKFYKDGRRTIQLADKDQVEILLDAGWSRTKPEVKKVEVAKGAGMTVKKLADKKVKELADKEVPVPAKPKSKKIRKIPNKK